jgi:predicted AlkP superfamily phosphohydrolase/phosphomutase
VALLGLDSLTPTMVYPMLEQGAMPTLARLAARGWWSEVVPTMPPTTPAGWTTVATGAWPSTHGIEGFAVHREGDPLDRKIHALTSDLVRAEPIWAVADRHGMESVLLKFPITWPPSAARRVTQVDGAAGWGGLKCVHDLVHSGCWDSEARAHAPAASDGLAQEWMTRDADNLGDESVQRLAPEPPRAWVGVPGGFDARFGATARLAARGGGAAEVHLLGGRVAQGGRLLVAARPDATGCRPLVEGEWSDWLLLDFGPGAGQGFARFKVMRLGTEPPSLRLYQSQVHRRDGFTRPEGLAAELEAAAGPFVEWTESYDRLQGWIDDPTQLELYRDHLEWMARASRHLLRSRPWRLFMTQVHVLDMAYHLYWGAIDPRHPDHRPELAARCWEILREVHRLADRLIAAVLAELDDETLFVVLGEHGHDLYHTGFLTNHLLIREGLLALRRDPRTGRPSLDWSRTRAYASSYRVYLNLRGRDPDGVVGPDERERVRDQVLGALYSVRDPRTGEAPVRLAIAREDARGLGLYGPSMGDVVFAMAPGFQARSSIEPPPECWIGSRLVAERLPVLAPTRLFSDFTGDHDTALPFSRSIQTLLYLHGRDIRPNRSQVPVRLVDVAPTVCEWLGLPPPADCEGSALWQALGPRHREPGGIAHVVVPTAAARPGLR